MSLWRDFSDGFASGSRSGGALGDGLAALLRPLSVKVGRHPNERTITAGLHREAEALFNASPLGQGDLTRFAVEVAFEACKRFGRIPSPHLLEALAETTAALMIDDGLWGVPELDLSEELGLEEGVDVRNYLAAQKRFFSDYDRLMDVWREKVVGIYAGMLDFFPEHVLTDGGDHGAPQRLSMKLIDSAEDPADLIEQLGGVMWDQEVVRPRLFETVREKMQRNLLLASGIDTRDADRTSRSVVMPTEAKGKTPSELVDLYLKGTPFATLFRTRCGFAIPEHARFEHTHVVGGTGHGKTELLKLLAHDDILASRNEKRSVVVIDSQGDLIRTLAHLRLFSPGADGGLAEKFVLIDPTDTDFPVCLNLFDMATGRDEGLAPVDRERVFNATVSLYEYMFGALLGAELTQRQGVIFKYLARLMMVIPGATVHTLRALMEDATPFKPYMAKLEGTARAFFETHFFAKGFAPTKQQILTRLWGVLSNTTFERMFSHEQNKVDVFEAMNGGKVVLVNTAKDLLQKDGSQILGRFFIALITQAALRRATIAEKERVPTFVYIDEAHEYFDEHIEDLLNQARKYRVGMVLAHQNLDQLSLKLKATITASTSVKLAGGVSAKDAAAFAKEMGATPEFIARTRKTKTQTEFACWVKHVTPQAVKVTVPLGVIDRRRPMRDRAYGALIAANRARYCAPAAESRKSWETPAAAAPTPSVEPGPQAPQLPARPPPEPRTETPPEPVSPPRRPAAETPPPRPPSPRPPAAGSREPAPLGHGGKQHKYLQGLVKQIAESQGYRATIEQSVDDGGGSIDVSLVKDDFLVACEISVTTSPDQELRNVEKCLAAGYGHVMVVSPEKKELEKLKASIEPALEEADLARVAFLLPADCAPFLSELSPGGPAAQTVRGYKVRLNYQMLSEAEQRRRRAAIGKVIAGSMKRMG